MGAIAEAARGGAILLADGAWGTRLQAMGLKAGECPELWNLERPDAVAQVAEGYVRAGSDLIGTNSFGGNAIRLRHFGLDGRAEELNAAAARISRSAAGTKAKVMGSIGPCGKLLMTGEVDPEELSAAFAAQARALERGGADAACVETMADLEEATLAIRAVRCSSGLEILCTFTFELGAAGARSMMGVSPAQAARALAEAGADIIGANCGQGVEGMAAIAAEMREAGTGLPILIQANAGLPVWRDGQIVHPASPERMARVIPGLVAAGASLIGGCCGTTPEHIAAFRAAIDGLGRRPA